MAIKTEIKALPASLLTVDPEVQRQLDPRRVSKIAADWDDLMVGVLTVSHRVRPVLLAGHEQTDPDSYVVLDGQTRLEAFRAVAGTPATTGTLICEVYEGLSRAEEADIFLKHNDRKAVHTRDAFRLAYTAGQDWAVQITEVLAANGYASRGVDLGRPMRQFDSISAAKKIYDAGGAEALRKTFTTTSNAWGSKSREAASAPVLYGVGMLHARHPELVSKQLHGFVTKLSRMLPGQVIAEIMTDRRRYRQSTQTAAYNWAVALYNRGRAPGNQIT